MTRDTREQVGKPSSKPQKDVPMLKIVIRCLPPTLTEEEFLKHIEPLSDHDFFCFVRAESSLEQYACSRAYLNFTNQNDVVAFRDKWDGFPFKDTNGREYPAVVELAPYQKIPKNSLRKPDPRCGTIEEDEDYKAFLEALNAEVEPLPSAETYLEELEERQRAAASARVTTPLIDFLKRKRIERNKAKEKAREERRKEKERRRIREEEKRKLEKERKRKREERERREKEKEARLKKEERSSEGEIKADAKKKETAEKKDAQIKLLKKTDSKSDQETKTKDLDRGSKEDSAPPPIRNKPEADRARRDGEPSSQSTPNRDRERPTSAARERTVDPKTPTGSRRPPGRDGREGTREARDSRDVREGREVREARDLKDKRDGRDSRDRRDGRDGRESDRMRGERGAGRDRYSDRRPPPPKASSSQDSLSKTAKTPSRDKFDNRETPREGQRFGRESRETRNQGPRDRDERRPAGGGREERLVGKGDVRGDRKESSPKKPATMEQSREAEKEAEAKREERKMRNKDRRPDMARYQPGQRSWRTSRKEEGSDSARTSPTSSEGDKPKPEQKKPVSSAATTSQPATAPPVRKVEEKRPTAAKKFDSQVRSGVGRSSGGREDNRGKADPRMGERNRSVGRGYREERSNRNRQRQGEARRKAEGTNGNTRATQSGSDKKT